jgi:hypothetical protein
MSRAELDTRGADCALPAPATPPGQAACGEKRTETKSLHTDEDRDRTEEKSGQEQKHYMGNFSAAQNQISTELPKIDNPTSDWPRKSSTELTQTKTSSPRSAKTKREKNKKLK